MLEKKYFEHWRITVKMRQHQRTQMALGGGDDMELKNMSASTGMQNGSASGGPLGGTGGGASSGPSEETGSSEGKETRSKILAKSLTLLTAGKRVIELIRGVWK